MKALPASVRVFERGWLSSNNVLLDDGETATLVDSGYLKHAAQTVELVRDALAGRRLTRLVNTHVHSDHIGGNASLQAAFGCRIEIPAGHAKPIDEWDEDALLLEPLAQRAAPFRADALIEPGDRFVAGELEWRALPVPGHDMDALAFHNAERRILIAGDALWESGFGVLFPELVGRPGAFAAARATLDSIGRLALDWVIPGHGRPFEEVDEALSRAHARLDALAASPERFARNALKVVLAFALMDRGRITRAALPGFFAASSFCTRVARDFLGRDAEALGAELAEELAAAGTLRAEGNDWRAD